MKKAFILALLWCSVVTAFAQQKAFTVKVVGKGQPILLIPGYSCSGEVWNETVEHLKDRYECHVLTLAGYAGAPAIDSPILESVKGEIISYVKQNKLKKPILLGHSLGSFMSLWVSSEAPDLFGKVVCVDGVPFISAMSDPGITEESVKNNPYMNPEQIVKNFEAIPSQGFVNQVAAAMRSQVADSLRARQIATWQFNSDRRTLGLTLYEISTTDLRQQIARIKQPVLVLGSLYNTKANSLRILGEQYSQLANKTIRVADSKHFIMYDQPQWFYAELDAFLK
ncbi:alpha/beta hydrolase [Pontibacter ramchanderi]|uniref:Pimeloyl-ACP methyl ester carboxylesterase n=1 Tax=Pontibacter ramchanderi TaxID=1179743 RepID=A0A2N3V467_9BACT|nr:alpha/beta hydrolase [Pontibacter ramchanderi]PKV76413.1 pimeloyl-ACP methyl ester carboxylesterase [Pontibacter ramchanderi]